MTISLQRVFCGSLMDWAEDNPQLAGFRDSMFATINATANNLRWLMLTKRANMIWEMLAVHGRAGFITNPNIWFGFSAENQEWYNKRIHAVVNDFVAPVFLSLEPLLGPIDLRLDVYQTAVRWVIVGGESGSQARRMELAWADDIIAQCKQYRIPVFFKQTGTVLAREMRLNAKKGDLPWEWPVRLNVQQTVL